MLLQAFMNHHHVEAVELLDPEQMMELLGAALPGGDHIACYSWRELPLKLLQTEASTSQHGNMGVDAAILGRVLRTGGDYESFDAYMECALSLHARFHSIHFVTFSGLTDALPASQNVCRPAPRGLLCRHARWLASTALWQARRAQHARIHLRECRRHEPTECLRRRRRDDS